MTVDARCLIATDLGRLLDGSGLSEDHAQETGLVTYRGTFIFDGLHTPTRGRVIQLAYVRPQYGASGTLGRFYPRLHVISSSADPFANKTTVEVGCALTLLAEKKTDDPYKATSSPPAWWTALTADRQAAFPPTIRAQSVIDDILSALNITLAGGSLTSPDVFLREEIDLSSGYVSVLSDLLRSALLVGHMTPDGELLVRSMDLAPETGPVLTRSELLSLQSINDRSGAEEVVVEYDAVEIESVEDSIDINSDEQKLRDWELEKVIGPVEVYRLVYYALRKTFGIGGLQSTEILFDNPYYRNFEIIQTTTTTTTYKTFEWKDKEGKPQKQDLALKREKITSSTADKIFIFSDLELYWFYWPSSGGIPFGGSELQTFEYEIKPEGPRLVREETNTKNTSRTYSSIVPYYGNDYGTLVSEQDVDSSKVVVDYTVDEQLGLTKTVTTRTVAQAKTQAGSIGVYTLIQAAINAAQARESAESGKGQTLVEVETKINYGREFGLQERPSSQARLTDAVTGGFTDNNSLVNSGTTTNSYGQREPQVVKANYTFGGAAQNTLSTATYRLPFAPDDYIIGTNGASTGIINLALAKGNARGRALEYGRIQNAIAFGHANGIEITTAPWELPSEPFASVYVDVSGLSTAFRVHGRNWEIRGGAMVVTADLMLVGTAGVLPLSTPIAWMPLASPPGDLNVLGVPTGSGEIVPANTIALPVGFSAAAPGDVWSSLPTNGSDTYGPSRTPAAIAPPYVQTVVILAQSRSVVVVTELNYSLTPITEDVEAISKSKADIAEVAPVLASVTDLTLTGLAPEIGTGTAAGVYRLAFGTVAPVLGATTATSYAGWTLDIDESIDDGYSQFGGWPFSLTLNEVAYNEVYIGSNGYLTFGAGSDEYGDIYFANPYLPKLLLGGGDRSYQRVFTKVGPDSVSLRWEGDYDTGASPGESTRFLEVTFFAPQGAEQFIEVRIGDFANPGGDFGLFTEDTELASGTIEANTSWVFTGNQTGTEWTLTGDSYVVPGSIVSMPSTGLSLAEYAPTVQGAPVVNVPLTALTLTTLPVNGDPYFAYVKLLLTMGDTNGSTSFTDSSSYAYPLTAEGNAQVTTSGVKFGPGSLRLTRSDLSSDYLLTPWNFSAGSVQNWTIECFCYADFYAIESAAGLFSYGGIGANSLPTLFHSEGQWYLILVPGELISVAPVSYEVWQHVAVVRQWTAVRVFINGVQQVSATISNQLEFDGMQMLIGSFGTSSSFNGKIEQFRVTQAIARYTANFTPPNEPFPDY